MKTAIAESIIVELMLRVIAMTFLMLTPASQTFAAASLLDYEKRVFRAAEQIDRIIADKEYHKEGADYIRQLLPKSEDVEMQGQVITVNNGWLHALLGSYSKDSSEDARRVALRQAASRLRALDEHLQLAAGEGQFADSKERIREILSRSEYREKTEDPFTAYIKKIRQQVFEFIRDLFRRIFNTLFGTASETSWLFRGIIIVALALGLFVATRMAMKMRRGKRRKKKRTVLGEEIEEGMTSRELAEAALAAARAGDFRAGIRKLYISLLYELAERNLLELEANATNHEYMDKVSRFGSLTQPMRYLTDKFDYFWYGMFPSSKEDFAAYLENYNRALEYARALENQPAKA